MEEIRQKLETSRKELLDLSLRNPLLNYRLLKSKGLEIVDEAPEEVYRIVVRQNRSMSFLPRPQDEQQGIFDAAPAGEADEVPVDLLAQPEEEDNDRIAERHRDDKLQTNYSSPRLQRRLLNTYYDARLSIEERGVNTLFLALGLLRWYESESSQIERLAPLVLVPVELYRTNVREKLKLRYTGEEIGSNLSLGAKLKQEFGKDLPEIGDPEDFEVQRYFAKVQELVARIPRWEIDSCFVTLGFFFFNKFLMYKDLDVQNWPDNEKPTEHHILQSILGEGFDEPSPDIDDEEHLDHHLPPNKIRQVVDADSSQVLALVSVNGGRNLVIQGPPGTGKSQTITNVVAEALGGNKTVLFVSEKMAALEVVKRRLDKVGLGDACLELHSQKTNKTAFLDELKRTLRLGKPKVAGGYEEDIASLKANRDRLNAYSEAMNAPVEPTKVTPYLAIGALVKIKQQIGYLSLPEITLPGASGWRDQDFRTKRELLERLQALLHSVGVPAEHPFWGSQKKTFLPTEENRAVSVFSEALVRTQALMASSAALSSHLLLGEVTTHAEVQTLVNLSQRILEGPDLGGISVSVSDWYERWKDLERLLDAAATLKSLHDRFDSHLIPQAWNADALQVRQVLAAYGQKWYRLLVPKYRLSVRELRGLCTVTLPKVFSDRLALVDAILRVQSVSKVLEQHGALAEKLFAEHWKGYHSDLAYLSKVSHWLRALHQDIEDGIVPREILEYLEATLDKQHLTEHTCTVTADLKNSQDQVQKVVDELRLDEERSPLREVTFKTQLTKLNNWIDSIPRVHEIVRFNHFIDEMEKEDLGPLIKVVATWKQASQCLTILFEYTWYRSLLERAIQERVTLAQFDGETHAQVIERFKSLDRQLLNHNRAILALQHWENLPRHSAAGQLGILLREFEKKRRHLPIRRIVLEAGNAVQQIKPVFMMSPLSIATYIPPGSIKFDIVVFDEASQVRPVEGFGAVLRGRQAVVVGDSRQLPPTSFFDQATEVDEEDEANVTADLESILGLFCAQNAPQRMLRWHYRSRHESLIAVSNFEFYDNRLVVFPSPDSERKRRGLQLRYLPNTTYDRGGARNNVEEAKTVAQAVMEHANLFPDLSLGVAAFSHAQMHTILDQLEILRRRDPSREHFFSGHPEEPFFVKNLENVQGDERDAIFISIGYGRTGDGYVPMNFGALNWDGGERRLNVLITRARLRCIIFTNLTSDDIDLTRSRSRGVVALKRFLKYAESRILDVPQQTNVEPDSPFEQAVALELKKLEYDVQTQVGTSGFFIDLAVLDPENRGRYLLGIECDGATYHSARSARDRDRLRQQVLEGLGWRIHRIWSTDWFRNPKRELERVVESIEAAKTQSQPQKQMRPSSRENPERQQSVEREPEVQPSTSDQTSKPYTVASLQINLQGTDLHLVPTPTMASWVKQVVAVEGPLHFDEVARRITEAAGLKRVGGRIRSAIRRAARHAEQNRELVGDGNFLSSPGMETAPIRDRSHLPQTSRKIQLVARAEIEAALEKVVKESFGIAQQEASQEVCCLFGFQRVTEEMSNHVNKIIGAVIRAGRIDVKEGHLQWRGD